MEATSSDGQSREDLSRFLDAPVSSWKAKLERSSGSFIRVADKAKASRFEE